MNEDDKRILKFLCYIVIQLVKAVTIFIQAHWGELSSDARIDLFKLSVFYKDEKVIDTLQEYFDKE